MSSLPDHPVVLVTRPDPDGADLANELSALGYRPLSAPLMRIEIQNQQIDLEGVQALAFTSANGVRAFADSHKGREFPVFAVGDATGRLAADMGFQQVAVAGGDVDLLADLMIGSLAPETGAVLHATGSHVAGDLAGRLKAAGFSVVSKKLYAATQIGALPNTIKHSLGKGEVHAVLLYSPRTASLFGDLVQQAHLEKGLHQTVAVCMSQNVATAIKSLPFKSVQVSSAPTKTAILEALENWVPHA